jgi:hypothetical protein
MTSFDSLNWIDSDGGPLILMEKEVFPSWNGDVEVKQHDTDYDRACNVEDYVGVIEVQPLRAIVFGDEPMRTTWWQIGEYEGIVVRWMYASDEESVIKALITMHDIKWEDSEIEISFPNGNLILFDSVYSYDEVEDSLSIQIKSGVYKIQTSSYQPNEHISLVLHRFMLKQL